MMINKEDLVKVGGSLKVCVGQEAGAETVFHQAHHIFKDQNAEAVLLIDPEVIFSAINRKAMLLRISAICSMTSTCINNCYNTPVSSLSNGDKFYSRMELHKAI